VNSPAQVFGIVALHELVDSARSRRVLVTLLLFLIGAMAGTAMFIKFLQSIETQLAQTLGLAAPQAAGSLTATLWKSASFRLTLTHMLGNRALAENLLGTPPLALFYGWLTLAFVPLLVMITAAPRVAEEVSSGSVRYVMFRASRGAWCLGKFAGQAFQILGALLASMVGAWLVGWARLAGFEPLLNAEFMLWYTLKAWIYALPFLGLAFAVSQLFASPNVALACGFIALVASAVLNGLAAWLAGPGWRRIWDVVAVITPAGHKQALWWNDAAQLLPAIVYLLALAAAYLLAGYARFARRDL
jgi:ABC-type transport system involved in multi-copper enzyme maturation permease subunit